MLCIVYISTAASPFSDDELAELLQFARERNSTIGVTGLLAYRDGRFLQLIEGPDEVIVERFAAIAADPRHRDVVELERTEIERASFPDWSMAYEPLDDATIADVPGFSDFLRSTRPLADAPSRTQAILHWFRRHPLASPQA